jgi:hypothetical protein
VTTALEARAKPFLIPWAAKLEREYTLVSVRRSGTAAIPASSLGEYRHAVALREAGELGTELHAAIEAHLQQQPAPKFSIPGALMAFQSFQRWRDVTKFTPIALEKKVVNLTHGYAGTLDALGWIELAKIGTVMAIVDWKTSRSFNIDHDYQNAAYKNALTPLDPQIYGYLLRLPKSRTDDGGYERRVITPAEHIGLFDAFLEILAVWKRQHGA